MAGIVNYFCYFYNLQLAMLVYILAMATTDGILDVELFLIFIPF